MPCNFISNKCNSCRNFVLSTSVALSGSNLVITIPQNNYANNCGVCIAVAQTIPAGVTAETPVVIQIGTSDTLYPLRTKCGHNVYADQICTRKIYCTRVATDTASFIYNGHCSLPCTNHVFPAALPNTVTPAVTTATKATGGNSVGTTGLKVD